MNLQVAARRARRDDLTALRRCSPSDHGCFDRARGEPSPPASNPTGRSATNVVTSEAWASGRPPCATRIKSVLAPWGRSTTAVRGSFLSWLLAGNATRLPLSHTETSAGVSMTKRGLLPDRRVHRDRVHMRHAWVAGDQEASSRPVLRRLHSPAARRAGGPGRRRSVPEVQLRKRDRRAACHSGSYSGPIAWYSPDDADRPAQGGQVRQQVDHLLVVIVWASPSGMSERSLVRRSSTDRGSTEIRCPSAVLITNRSGVSSTGSPVMTRPSASAATSDR